MTSWRPWPVTLLLCLGCTPEVTEDPALTAWAAQMDAAGKAVESADATAAQTHLDSAARIAQADGRLRLVVRSLEGLAQQAAGRGDFAAADSLFRSILSRQLDSLRSTGVPADDLLRTLGTLGDIALQLGDLDRASGYYDQILELADEGWLYLSPERPHLSLVLSGQARVLQARGDSAGAARIGIRATGLRHYAHGHELYAGQRYDEAEKQLKMAVTYQTQHLGATHPDVAATRRDLAHVLDLLGRSDEAANLSQE